MKLLIFINLQEKYLDMIKEAVNEIEIVKTLELEVQKNEISDADIILTGSIIRRELLLEAGPLQWIQTWSAGVESYISDEIIPVLKEKNIKLTSMSGIHGEPIAETVMGYLINFSRRLYEFYDHQKEKVWQKLEVGQLAGKNMVIVGTGSIGSEIAKRAKAFGMKTIGVKRNVNKEVEYIDRLYSREDLTIALKQGDYIVVTLPLTEETRGMFSKKEFAIMRKTAFFINIGRGAVVDERALIVALEKGEIAGAGLDVFLEEPLSADSPFYSLKNVYITPHISGAHPNYNFNATRLFIENLQKYKDGKELNNIVDYSIGY